MVPASYHDFFSGCATISGALIGLLFVAISVSPQKLAGDQASTDHQVKAGAAFSALINTLVVALVALMPGTGLATAGIILGASGLSTSAGLVIVLYRDQKERIRFGQAAMLVVLIALYGLELGYAIQLDGSPRDVNAVDTLGTLAILFFLFAIARAWQLVGARDRGLLSTVTELAERRIQHAAPPPPPGPDRGPGDPPG